MLLLENYQGESNVKVQLYVFLIRELQRVGHGCGRSMQFLKIMTLLNIPQPWLQNFCRDFSHLYCGLNLDLNDDCSL